MNISIINKKTVKKNAAMKAAQKEAKKYYGLSFGGTPKGRIDKVVSLKSTKFISNSFFKETDKSSVQSITTADELIQRIQSSGLTGLSGNGFPVSSKLETLEQSGVKERYLIINAVECDPGLVHDYYILHHFFDHLIAGIKLLNQCFSFTGIYLASKEKLSYEGDLFSAVKVPNRYPMGYEHLLIEKILGKTFSKDVIPTTQGILTINVQTLLAISSIALNGENFSDRYLTIADIEHGTAFVTKASIGTNATSLMNEILPNVQGTLYIGGGVMNCHPLQPDELITSETCFIGYGHAPAYEASTNCKGCGGCSRTCPAGVKVHKIIQAVEKGQTDGLEAFHPEKCIGCGCCSYGCVAGKNILEVISKINGNAN